MPKNVRILLDKETVGCGLCLQMAMIRDEDTWWVIGRRDSEWRSLPFYPRLPSIETSRSQVGSASIIKHEPYSSRNFDKIWPKSSFLMSCAQFTLRAKFHRKDPVFWLNLRQRLGNSWLLSASVMIFDNDNPHFISALLIRIGGAKTWNTPLKISNMFILYMNLQLGVLKAKT